jgi:diaminohydroxyphosphoribosylaminopyrimidine deaminase/5-amino-6-(5-phosphoribosylamino)uracil reductase
MNDDEQWMKRAIRLAEKGRGRTSPNPLVGAILVKEGIVVGKGYHAKAGEAHAEIIALRKAGEEARGSTLYINLEPCTHYGKTPPCAPVIIQAGVRRVVVGTEDPNPLVTGKGVESLRKAGLEVKIGVLEKECQRLNEAFHKYILKREPFVILKVAATLDGRIATRDGESKWISGETSRGFVQRLRDEVDGVVVGINTILKDDPMLTARFKGGRDPFRIVLDSRLRIPEEARVVKADPSKTIIATTGLAARDKGQRLENMGAQILVLDSKHERVSLKPLLSKLGEKGITSLLVEGGSQVNGSFFDEGLIDKLLLFLSPKMIGDDQAIGIFGGKGMASLIDAVPLRELRVRRIGEDILIEGYVGEGTE